MKHTDNSLDPEVVDLLEETEYKRIAQGLIAGLPVTEIAKQLDLTPRRVRTIVAKDETKQYLKEQAELMVSAAANTWRAAMQSRVPAALKTLDKLLKEGDAEGVKIVMRSLGVDKPAETQQQAQTISVILPDMQKTIEIEK